MRKPDGIILKNGYWHVQTTVSNGLRKKFIRKTTRCKEKELDKAKRRLAEIIAGELPKLNDPVINEHTFEDAAIEYVESLEERGKATESTEYILERVMVHIGHLPLSHVHQGSLNPWIKSQFGVRKSSTVKRTLGVVVAVLNHAARVLRDDNVPWLSVAVPKIQSPDWNDGKRPYKLTWEEQDDLFSRLPAHLRSAALFAIATGAREQEIASLKWQQECEVTGMPEGSVWWVPPEVRKGNAKRSCSEQEGRYLICNAMARSVINANRDSKSEWVFPGPKGIRVQRWNNTAWRNARSAASLPVRFHDLRHTFGERASVAGVPWDFRKALLGHEIRDITAHYSAPGLKLLLDEAEKVTRKGAVILRAVTRSVTRKKAV